MKLDNNERKGGEGKRGKEKEGQEGKTVEDKEDLIKLSKEFIKNGDI